eukprot:tig00020675_g12679.t1
MHSSVSTLARGAAGQARPAAGPPPLSGTLERITDSCLHPAYAPIHESVERHTKAFVDARSATGNASPQVMEALYEICGPAFVQRHYASVARAPHVLQEPFMLPEFRAGLFADLRAELTRHVMDALAREGTYSSDAYKKFRRAVGDSLDEAIAAEGTKTDGVAGALTAVLEEDPTLWSKVRSLAGYPLPIPLRRGLWRHSLFDEAVARGVEERLAKQGSEQSELFNLIRVMQSELFAKDLYQFRAHSERALQALNAFHLCFREFSPRILRLLAPLLAIFPQAPILELVPMLVKLAANGVPSPQSARPLAMRAFRRLKRDDPELWRHIRESFDEDRLPRRGFRAPAPPRDAAPLPVPPAPAAPPPPAPRPPSVRRSTPPTPSRVQLPPSRSTSSVASSQPPTPSHVPLPPSTAGSSRPPSLHGDPPASPAPAPAPATAPSTPPPASTPPRPAAPPPDPEAVPPGAAFARGRYHTRLRKLMLRMKVVVAAAKAFREGPEEVGIVGAAMESGFVGYLAHEPLLYLWDQAFMSSWEAALVDVAVASLRGSRAKLLAAPTASALRREMREHPLHLATGDLQRAGRPGR